MAILWVPDFGGVSKGFVDKGLVDQSVRNRLRRRSRQEAFGKLSGQPVFPASKYTGAVFASASFGTPLSLGAWCKRAFRSDPERDVGAQERRARVIMISAPGQREIRPPTPWNKDFRGEETMGNFTRRGFVGSLSGIAGATMVAGRASGALISPPQTPKASGPIKITDLKCAIIGRNPTVRIVTDQGISGYGQAESAKP